ncbi:MAG: cell division topological specificity factor MinE [Brachyspira sp.]|nr:cell division topological specificity factor MinE [Brachyspira sp.]
MKEIFTDFYNTILGFFRQTEKKEENAKDVACNRLRVVLMQDRTNLTPELLQRMRQELIELLSKYVEMDKEALELNFEQDGNQMALMLSIPVLRAKEESEIEEAEAQDEAEVSDENSDEEEESETVDDESEVEISEEEAVETSGNAEEEADEDSEKIEK